MKFDDIVRLADEHGWSTVARSGGLERGLDRGPDLVLLKTGKEMIISFDRSFEPRFLSAIGKSDGKTTRIDGGVPALREWITA